MEETDTLTISEWFSENHVLNPTRKPHSLISDVPEIELKSRLRFENETRRVLDIHMYPAPYTRVTSNV